MSYGLAHYTHTNNHAAQIEVSNSVLWASRDPDEVHNFDSSSVSDEMCAYDTGLVCVVALYHFYRGIVQTPWYISTRLYSDGYTI